MREAAPDKGSQFRQGDTFTQEALFPETKVSADDTYSRLLINRRIVVTDTPDPGSCFIGDDDCLLVDRPDAGVRDDGRKKQGVCMAALGAFYSADL